MQNFRAAKSAIDSNRKSTTRARAFKRGLSEARTQSPELDAQLEDLSHATINERSYVTERLVADDLGLEPERELAFGGDAW